MGRKLNVALLLAMHLGFFACAGLIVGPLLTDGANSGGETTIAVKQSKPGSEVNTEMTSQKNLAKAQFQEGVSYERDWLGKRFNQNQLDWGQQTDLHVRQPRPPFARRLAP